MANPNKPTTPHRKFDKAFKAEALRMLDEGQSVAQVAKSLNVSDQLLNTWKHAHKKQIQKQVGNSELLAENERLKAQLKRAEMERDILKSFDKVDLVEYRRQQTRSSHTFTRTSESSLLLLLVR